MSKILIVEDDPMIAEIYKKKFIAGGFDVEVAASGREVFSFLKKEKADLVLLDLVLPEMNGTEILKELKKSGSYDPAMKVIIFSNLNEDDNREEAFKLGADGFISKTQFSPSELVKEIQRILKEYQRLEKNDQRETQGNDSAGDSSPRKKILLIEDEEIFTEMFGERLKKEGYDVVTAQNGAWGLKEITENDFDMLITDMTLPAMSGEEVVAAIRQNEKTKNIPVIVISASVGDEAMKRAGELGIADFFVKTRITPSDLAERVAEILK